MFPLTPDQHHWLEVATEDEGWCSFTSCTPSFIMRCLYGQKTVCVVVLLFSLIDDYRPSSCYYCYCYVHSLLNCVTVTINKVLSCWVVFNTQPVPTMPKTRLTYRRLTVCRTVWQKVLTLLNSVQRARTSWPALAITGKFLGLPPIHNQCDFR